VNAPTSTTAWRSAQVIARYEWRLLWRDYAYWVTVGLLMTATIGGWYTGRAWASGQQRLVATLLQEQQRRLDDLQARIDRERTELIAKGTPLTPVRFGLRHATTIGHYSGQRWMVQPAWPTAPLALGELDLQPLGYLASVDRWQGQTREQFTSPLWLRFVRFDVQFVVAYLFPLGLMLVSGAIVSAEREHGTLQLRLSQGARLARLSFGRLAMRGGLASVLVGVLTACLILSSGGSFAQLLVWQVGFVGYALFWLALIAWVDAGTRSVAANLLTCTGLWIVLLFVLPALVRSVADSVRPLPSRAAFERAQREAYQQTWNGRNEEILEAFYQAHPEIPRERDEKGGLERYAIFQMRALELIRDTLLPLEQKMDEDARRHRQLLYQSRFVSPLFLLHDVSTTAAGTDLARLEHFRAHRDRFLQRWENYYASRIYTREPIEDLRQTPTFAYEEPPLSRQLPSLFRSVAGLVVPGAVLIALALSRFRRYAP
jgi:hypothetical protein